MFGCIIFSGFRRHRHRHLRRNGHRLRHRHRCIRHRLSGLRQMEMNTRGKNEKVLNSPGNNPWMVKNCPVNNSWGSYTAVFRSLKNCFLSRTGKHIPSGQPKIPRGYRMLFPGALQNSVTARGD